MAKSIPGAMTCCWWRRAKALEDADYYYMGTYDYRLDTRGAGRRNADGAGRFDAGEGTYTFEFRKELMSGDGRDAQLCTGCDFSLIYGWASY